MDEVDQICAESRILEHHVASFADQSVAEHQPVLLVAQLRRKRSRPRDYLEGGLKQTGQGVADGAGDASQYRYTKGHVVHDLHGRSTGFVHDAHRHLGHDQHGEHQHHRAQPFPALELLWREGVGDQGGHEATKGDSRDSGQVVV